MEHLDLIIGVLILVYTITLHELGHAYASDYFGDPTPARHGRLTFNPIVQLDPFYSVAMPFICFIFFGFPLGWAYCPVDPSRYKRPLRDNALVSLAGPMVNFAVVLVCIGMLWLRFATPPGSFNEKIFLGVGTWSLLLGIFNLLPLPGLDGYGVARAIMPLSLRQPLDNFRRMGWLPLMLAILVGSTVIGRVFWPAMDGYLSLLPEDDRYYYDILRRWFPR